jgi:hypothetical protein
MDGENAPVLRAARYGPTSLKGAPSGYRQGSVFPSFAEFDIEARPFLANDQPCSKGFIVGP